MQLPAPGQLFQRKYKLQEVLGRGGFAAVYRATDVEIGRDVAIKVLAPGDDGYSTGIASRFMREARVIGSFQDPHTITMFEFGRSDDGLLFMVFEYVKGKDLAAVIRSRGALTQQEVVHILRQVLQSLREAHYHGVLHRDIKPANILVYDYMGDPNRVKLLDFGIAKAVAGDQDGVNLTREGAMIGTPRYMSPEQIYGGDLTPRSDLYSLGLVAHEMLVGRPAIEGSNSKEMLRAQLADAPVRLPRGRVLATEAFCEIIDRLTARDPNLRFESATEVLQALEWLEANDRAVPPVARSGPLASMDVAPLTPRPDAALGPRRFDSGVGQRFDSGAGQRFDSGAGQRFDSGAGQRFDSQTGRPPSGPYNPHPHGPPPTPSGGWTADRSGDRSYPPGPGATPVDDAVPSTERPRTLVEEDDGSDVSLGTVLGAGLGAAALVVGLLLLMSFLSEDEAPSAPTLPPTMLTNPAGQPQQKSPVPPQPVLAPEVGPSQAEPDVGEPAAPQQPAVTGCNKSAPWRGERTLTMTIDGRPRQFLTYLPASYDSSKSYPAVFMFHETLHDGRSIMDGTRFRQLADAEGFVIIAPNAYAPNAPWPGGDGPFMAAALEKVSELACLDRTRVFAFGHGQGAVMARDLPCTMPVSAVALTGASIRVGESLCTPKRPVPVIRFHGKDDRYTPFEGGQGCLLGRFHSVEEIETMWRERNSCDATRTQYSKRGPHVCHTWGCDTRFVSCHLEGGHDWPTFDKRMEVPNCVAPAPDYPFAQEIWKFFTSEGVALEATP